MWEWECRYGRQHLLLWLLLRWLLRAVVMVSIAVPAVVVLMITIIAITEICRLVNGSMIIITVRIKIHVGVMRLMTIVLTVIDNSCIRVRAMGRAVLRAMRVMRGM